MFITMDFCKWHPFSGRTLRKTDPATRSLTLFKSGFITKSSAGNSQCSHEIKFSNAKNGV